jgi:pyruvate formate lyase activating enzyme
MNGSPLIVEIKRGSLEDGPGIRSVVFFKGCPLRCVFCHSPETQDPGVEIAFSDGPCLRCGRCVHACPAGAIDLRRPGRIDRVRCTLCGRCCEVCPGRALRRIGRYYRVENLMEILRRDLPFYRHSRGGVTLSGGECTLFPDYLEPLLQRLKEERIHVALQTCGCFDLGMFQRRILPYLDLVYYDVKFADSGLHCKYTGRPNERIIENLRCLLGEAPARIHPRIPLIPGVTATRRNLSALVRLLRAAGAGAVSLLPYNPMGMHMSECLGRARPNLPERFMTPEEEAQIRTLFQEILAGQTRAIRTG